MSSRDSSTSRGSSRERPGFFSWAMGRGRKVREVNLDQIDVVEDGPSNAMVPFDIETLPPPDFEEEDGYIEDNYVNGGDDYESSADELPPRVPTPPENAVNPRRKSGKVPPSSKVPISKRDAETIAFTKSNPLGQVLLGLLEDNLRLQEKAGITESSVSAVALCNAFHKQIEEDKLKMRLELKRATEQTEKRILTSEINSLSTMDEELVPSFSKTPKLRTNSDNVVASRLFPTRNKFSGNFGGDSPSLQEFFASLRTAQGQMALTEKEFCKMLLNCTSGKAHELCQTWIDSGENAKSIFFNLSLQFDRRISPEQARLKLTNLMAPKSTDIAKHISTIMSLAQRAACALPPGNTRSAYFNNEAVNCLIRSLPPTSKNTASNMFHQLSAKAKRAITFNELARPLINIRDTIDQDIHANGAGGSVINTKGQAQKIKRTYGKGTTYSINVPEEVVEFRPPEYQNSQRNTKPHWHGKNKANQVSQVNYHGQMVNQINASRPQGNQGNYQGPPQGNQSNYQGPRQGNGNNYYQGNQNGPRQTGARPKQNFGNPRGKAYCSLCGLKNHTAANGCRNMKDDLGKILNVQPSQSYCSACPPNVTPRLNHPQVLCPFRVGGPLYGTR